MLQLLLALHLTISHCGQAELVIEIPEHGSYCRVSGNPEHVLAFAEHWYFAAWNYTDMWRWYISEEMDQERYEIGLWASKGEIYMGYDEDGFMREAFDFALKQHDGPVKIMRTEKY